MVTSKTRKTNAEELKKLQKNRKIRNDARRKGQKMMLAYPLINQN